MLSAVSGFVQKRRRGLGLLASLAGGAYLLTSYARQRFADLSERLVLDRAAKENLRRRFQQNQQDCAFTLLALLPTLSKQVLEELDVEALTAELQRRAEETKKSKATATALTDSTITLDNDTVHVNGHVSPKETEKQEVPDVHTAEAASIPLPAENNEATEVSDEKKDLSDNGSVPEPVGMIPESTPDPRSKAELWQAVKILTFHRTVTTLYLLSLLALQTHIQLNLLGRHNYVTSVYQQASPFALSGLSSLFDDEALAEQILAEANGLAGEGPSKSIHAITERQYLTCAWWLLQKGWREVSERVRVATEEALESISLKSQLGSLDLNKLLLDIRRKVEYESTGAVHSFSSAIFPMTATAEQETLHESGIGDTHIDPALRSLLDETKDFIDSPDFSIVLRSCLDKSFALLSTSIGHLFFDEESSLPPLPPSHTGVRQNRFSEVQEKKVRLAAILPALARCSHTVLNGIPNEFAEVLGENRELQEFSAVVYSNFILEQ